jgi:glycosyltransferase involved in cell wall biosynthesis
MPGTVVALTASDQPAALEIPALGPGSRDPRTLLALRRRLGSVDVVVAHGSDTLLAAHLALAGTGVPYVYQVIGDPDVWGEIPLAGIRVGRPLRAAAAVSVLWAAAGEAVTRRYQVPAERIHVVGNGRDPNRFRPATTGERTAARSELGLTDDRPMIAWIGALSEEKQPLVAVEVAALLPDAEVVIVGDGPQRDALKRAAIAARERGATITVLGAVEDTERVLRGADALLVTSRTEGVPGVVVEAALSGVPTVAPDLGGLSTLVDDRTGALVAGGASPEAYRDALRHVLVDRGTRGAAARERAFATCTVDAVASAWQHLLAQVVSGHAST